MKKIIFCIVVYLLSSSIGAYSAGLELTDVIKQARDVELKKELAVKNTVKEMKENIATTEQLKNEQTEKTAEEKEK